MTFPHALRHSSRKLMAGPLCVRRAASLGLAFCKFCKWLDYVHLPAQCKGRSRLWMQVLHTSVWAIALTECAPDL